MGFLFGLIVFFLSNSTDGSSLLSCSSERGASFYICLKLCSLLGNMLPTWKNSVRTGTDKSNHSRDWKRILGAQLCKIMNSKTEQINPASNLLRNSLHLWVCTIIWVQASIGLLEQCLHTYLKSSKVVSSHEVFSSENLQCFLFEFKEVSNCIPGH